MLSQLLRCFVGRNLKSWENWLPHIEFSYNKVINKITCHSPFELVYGSNPLSLLYILPLPVQSKDDPKGLSKVQSIVTSFGSMSERRGFLSYESPNYFHEG
ncbi:hypothetical protein CR513_33279, partial [Mucuna pruriens]